MTVRPRPRDAASVAQEATLARQSGERPFDLADVTALRVKRRTSDPPSDDVSEAAHSSTSRRNALPARTPSNRSEAIRLQALLDSFDQHADSGGWEHRCAVYDQAFAEAVLQVGNHCAERGELLQRLRKFHQLCLRKEKESREAVGRLNEGSRNAIDEAAELSERVKALEAEGAASRQKIEMLTGTSVRLRILRAVHGRKLLNAELQIKELERDLANAKAAAGEREAPNESMSSPLRQQPGSPGLRNQKRHSSGQDSSLAEQLTALRKLLEQKDFEVSKMRVEKADIQAQLAASEAEVGAMLTGIADTVGQQIEARGGDLPPLPPERRAKEASAASNGAEANLRTSGQHGGPAAASRNDGQGGGQFGGEGEGGEGGGGQGGGNSDGSFPSVDALFNSSRNAGQHGQIICPNCGSVASLGGRAGGKAGADANANNRANSSGGESSATDTEVEALRLENSKLKAQLRFTRAALVSRSSSERRGDGASFSGEELGSPTGSAADSHRISRGGAGRTGYDDSEEGRHQGGGARPFQRSSSSRMSGRLSPVANTLSSGTSTAGTSRAGGRGGSNGDAGNEAEDGHSTDGVLERGRSPGGLKRGASRRNVTRQTTFRNISQPEQHDESGEHESGRAAEVSVPGKQRRHRSKPMITSLKGAKVVPRWIVLKAIGSLMQARIEYELEMARRGESDEQDIGEFIEDRFVELYGKGKYATDHLRDMIKGLQLSSGAHVRIRTFRTITALVPGDDEAGGAVSASCADFTKLLLRMLVEALHEDHLSNLRGSAFWTHYGRNDELKIPTLYWEKIFERLGAMLKPKSFKSKRSLNAAAATTLNAKQQADTFRAWKALEKSMADCAGGKIKDKAELQVSETGTPAKVIEVGDFPKGKVKRVDLDCFVDSAMAHYTELEDLEEEIMVQAYDTWDVNSDGKLSVEEFTEMIYYANPQASRPRVTRAFMVASGGTGEQVDSTRLAQSLIANGFKLEERPPGGVGDDAIRLRQSGGDEAVPNPKKLERLSKAGISSAEAVPLVERTAARSLQSIFQLTTALARMAQAKGIDAKDLAQVTEEDVLASV